MGLGIGVVTNNMNMNPSPLSAGAHGQVGVATPKNPLLFFDGESGMTSTPTQDEDEEKEGQGSVSLSEKKREGGLIGTASDSLPRNMEKLRKGSVKNVNVSGKSSTEWKKPGSQTNTNINTSSSSPPLGSPHLTTQTQTPTPLSPQQPPSSSSSMSARRRSSFMVDPRRKVSLGSVGRISGTLLQQLQAAEAGLLDDAASFASSTTNSKTSNSESSGVSDLDADIDDVGGV
jgi:hypothetical protein